jgi:2-hydroxychromene-2-carboxylate isomerase
MGKDDEVKGKQLAQKTLQKHADTPLAAQAGAGGTSTEARFLAALQAMMGDVELTDESVRQAIAKMTPEQKQQLMQDAGGQQLKRELLTNEETKQDRSLYFKEVNRSAEAAGLPVDKDNSHLTKKVRRAQRRLAAAAAWPICVRFPCQWAPHIS